MLVNLYSIMKKGITACALLLTAAGANAQCSWSKFTPFYNSPTPLYTSTTPCSGNPSVMITTVKTTGAVTNLNNVETSTTPQCGGATGYQYFGGAGNTLVVNAGTQVTCSLTAAGTTNFFAKVYCWIDKQHDGRFDLTDTINISSSFVGTGGTNPVGFKFTIPITASNGPTRMRFRLGMTNTSSSTGFTADACQTFPTGETEDYDINIINPCLAPQVISVSNITCNSADIAWSTRGNAYLYDYWVDTTGPYGIGSYPWPTGLPLPFGAAFYNLSAINNVHVPGIATAGKNLLPHTKYYVYIRSICDTVGKPSSQYWDTSAKWAVDSFMTLTCCETPTVTVSNITSKNATANWNAVPTVQIYDVLWTIQPGTPNGNSYYHTSATTYTATGLQPATTYYFQVRANCSEVPYSDWGVGQFGTLNTTSITTLDDGSIGLLAFPNPVKDMLSVTLSGNATSKLGLLQITDVSGRIVYMGSAKAGHVDVNTANWANGLYFVKYSNGNSSRTVKVTKQ